MLRADRNASKSFHKSKKPNHSKLHPGPSSAFALEQPLLYVPRGVCVGDSDALSPGLCFFFVCRDALPLVEVNTQDLPTELARRLMKLQASNTYLPFLLHRLWGMVTLWVMTKGRKQEDEEEEEEKMKIRKRER
jgi:hypothetical protein